MKKKLRRLDRVIHGLILCHSADETVPQGKNYERVFVYHGTSDKIFDYPDGKLDANLFEYYLVTGPKDLYKLKNFTYNNEDLEKKVIKIGMFRSDPIFSKSYNKEKLKSKCGINSKGIKIILYAPTWSWGGGTLKRCFEIFAKRITQKYILIVRPHYFDRKNVRSVLNWQREHKQENLYIFHKQYHDIMDFVYISDLMIGDNSAVNYEFALTKRPMVFVKSETKDVFTPPDQFNIKLCGPMYDPETDDIVKTIEEAFNNDMYADRISKLVDNSFYYNDGHAVDRVCSFIVDKLTEKGILSREKALKKYGGKFIYVDNY